MLARVSRVAVRAVRTPAVLASVPARGLAAGDGIHDRERALEKAYFNKEEEKLMRKLLSKVKAQVEETDVTVAKARQTTEKTKLLEIVGKYNMSDADIRKLVEWRHDEHF